MITLTDKMKVIQMHLTGYSNHKIARELGVNRKTVGKYVAEYEAAQAAITDPSALPDAVQEAAESISAAPEYKERKSPPRKWNAEMDDFLDDDLCQVFGHGSLRNYAAMGSPSSAGFVRSKNDSMAFAGIW